MKSLDVEITNYCNVNCSFCPRDSICRPKGVMNESVFNTLLNWIPENYGITFSGMGEPLINPNVDAFIYKLGLKNIKVLLKTNGFLLTPYVFDKLIESAIWNIQISIISGEDDLSKHGINIEAFRKLENNLEYISSKNDPPVSFNIVKENDSKSNINRLSFAKRFKIPISETKIHSRGGELYKLNEIYYNKYQKEFCQIFPYISFITWEGNILSCCHDIKGTSTLGNIANTSFLKLEKIKKDRVKNNKWFSVCNHCDDELRNTFKERIVAISSNS